mgnify:CR=1 FL=1
MWQCVDINRIRRYSAVWKLTTIQETVRLPHHLLSGLTAQVSGKLLQVTYAAQRWSPLYDTSIAAPSPPTDLKVFEVYNKTNSGRLRWRYGVSWKVWSTACRLLVSRQLTLKALKLQKKFIFVSIYMTGSPLINHINSHWNNLRCKNLVCQSPVTLELNML